jgi:hypothetical protein
MNRGQSFFVVAQTPSNQSAIISIAHRAGLTAGIVAVIGLLMLSAGAAQAQSTSAVVDYLESKYDFEADRVIEISPFHLLVSGSREEFLNGTRMRRPIRVLVDLYNKTVPPISLAFAGNPNNSGNGQNISRDGSCVVGFQDSGLNKPFRALRWTQATGPVNLGTLDTANDASLSSFGTDTKTDTVTALSGSNSSGAPITLTVTG